MLLPADFWQQDRLMMPMIKSHKCIPRKEHLNICVSRPHGKTIWGLGSEQKNTLAWDPLSSWGWRNGYFFRAKKVLWSNPQDKNNDQFCDNKSLQKAITAIFNQKQQSCPSITGCLSLLSISIWSYLVVAAGYEDCQCEKSVYTHPKHDYTLCASRNTHTSSPLSLQTLQKPFPSTNLLIPRR